MPSGFWNVGTRSSAFFEYCSAFSSRFAGSCVAGLIVRGIVDPRIANVCASFGVSSSSFSPAASIFFSSSLARYPFTSQLYTSLRYRLSGYFCTNASPNSFFFLKSTGGASRNAFIAASSSAFTGGGVGAASNVRGADAGLSLPAGVGAGVGAGCCAAPRVANADPARVSATKIIPVLIHFSLSLFIIFSPFLRGVLQAFWCPDPRAPSVPPVGPAPEPLALLSPLDTPPWPGPTVPLPQALAPNTHATSPAPAGPASPHVPPSSTARKSPSLARCHYQSAPPRPARTTHAAAPDT